MTTEHGDFQEYRIFIVKKLEEIEKKLISIDSKIDVKFDYICEKTETKLNAHDKRITYSETKIAVIEGKAAILGFLGGVVISIIINLLIKYL